MTLKKIDQPIELPAGSYLSVAAYARVRGLNRNSVLKQIKTGKLEHYRTGDVFMIKVK